MCFRNAGIQGRGTKRPPPRSARASYSLFLLQELAPPLAPVPPALAPLAFAEEEEGRTSIRLGNAASLRGAVIRSTPLLYSAETLEVSTPSGSSMVRSMRP